MNAPLPHHLAAVWFADIVGYTAQSDSDEAVAQRLVQVFAGLTKEVVAGYGGRVVKFLGDGALVEFSSTEVAVRSAWALTTAFPQVAESAGLGERRLRVGLHVGDVAQGEDGDLFGDGVNVASRIQSMADAGELWVSDDVRRQLRQRREFTFESRGERTMKGFDGPIEIHAVEVVGEEVWVPALPQEAREPLPLETHLPSRWRYHPQLQLILPIAVGFIALIGLAAWWMGKDAPASSPDVPADQHPSTVTAVAPDRSIAVLPFENLSPDPNDAFFAAGIADDILSALARIPEMDVISRTSTAQYEGSTKPVRQIAEELGVGNVLEGSVRRAGNRIRIVVQLIDAKSDRHLWTETYDRELTDVFAVQSEIAEKVATALDVALSAEVSAQLASAKTDDPEAYALFLQGRELLYHAGEDVESQVEKARAAMSLFRRSLERDPNYAAAWAGLGQAYVTLGWSEDAAWADSAAVMARKAVEIDPTSSQAYLALASAHSLLGRMSEGFAAIRQAAELEPNDPDVLRFLAGALFYRGRFDEALSPALKLVRVEPGQPMNSYLVVGLYTELEMYDEAEALCRVEIEQRPGGGAIYAFLADVEFFRGDMEGAQQALDTALALSPRDGTVLYTRFVQQARRGDFEAARGSGEQLAANSSEQSMTAATLGYVYERLGDHQRATALYRAKRRSDGLLLQRGTDDWFTYVEMARLEILDGNRAEALRLLEGAYDRGMRDLVQLRLDPVLALIESDPAYTRLIDRIEADVARMRERVRAAERKTQN
jgi:adenylate cyclase